MTPDTRFVLVLGGGGMKGLAHVGVLQALEERNLIPTHIVGSSVGALVGAAWAAGMPIQELRSRAIAIKRKEVFVIAHYDMAFKRMRSPALYKRQPLEQLIGDLIGGVSFRELKQPLVVNTVDINSGMQVFWGLPGLDDVPVSEAVFASCALPGMLPPREIRGRFYADGAAVNNLPVGIARTFAADIIVAADIGASSVFRADVQDEGFAAVYARAQEIAIQTMGELRLQQWTRPPIYYIHPRVEHVSMFSFENNRELVEEGHRSTATALDDVASWPENDDIGVFPKRWVTVRVERDRCIGCGACLLHGPEGMFVLDPDGKAVVTRPEQEWSPMDGGFIRHCPTYAISARPVPIKKAREA